MLDWAALERISVRIGAVESVIDLQSLEVSAPLRVLLIGSSTGLDAAVDLSRAFVAGRDSVHLIWLIADQSDLSSLAAATHGISEVMDRAGVTWSVVQERDFMRNVSPILASALAGLTTMSAGVAASVLRKSRLRKHADKPDAGRGSCLSDRETQILELAAKGLRQKEIAGVVGLSSHTVAGHFKTIYDKLEVNSRAEAIFEAFIMGYLRARRPPSRTAGAERRGGAGAG